jgi:hypothetical protein
MKINTRFSNQPYLIVFVFLMLMLYGCSSNGISATTTPTVLSGAAHPSEVDWEAAVEILKTGEVEMVTQLHNLDVFLTLKDGTEIKTVEPRIDAVFEEIDKCGQPCSQILLATE